MTKRVVRARSAASAGAGGVWSVAHRRLTVGLVATVTLAACEALAVSTVMPRVARDLGLGGYGPALSAFFLGTVVGVLLGGAAADRFGARLPFLAAAVLFGTGLVVAGLAPSIAVLVLARTLQGIGSGGYLPASYATVARCYAEPDRVRIFALLATAWVAPGAVGPFVAGALADTVGWRWVFIGLLPLVVTVAALTVPALPGPAPPDGAIRRLPVADALAVATGVGLLLTALDSTRWIIAAALAPTGLVIGSRARRVLPAGVLRLRPGVPAAVVVQGLLALSFITVDAFAPLAVTSVRGESVLVGAIAVALDSLTWALGAWLADRLLPVRPPQTLIRAGFALLAVGIGVELALLVPALPLVVGFAGGALAGLGIGLAYSPLSVAVLVASEPGTEGFASSALLLFENLGFTFGTALVGALVAAGARGRWDPAMPLAVSWSSAAVVAVLGAVLAQRVRVDRGPNRR
ncbi:MAG: MFS transporter [Pseudonocardiales bacterium]|nr:MFS transporter [Pseudonocardiales bacterium]